MSTSSKENGKKMATLTISKSSKVVYDHNEEQLTLAKQQYEQLKSDTITTIQVQQMHGDFTDNVMHEILLEPTHASKVNELFKEILDNEGKESARVIIQRMLEDEDFTDNVMHEHEILLEPTHAAKVHKLFKEILDKKGMDSGSSVKGHDY
ncbi:hypothetical protein ACFE04_011387 [Oxalis oulophora]